MKKTAVRLTCSLLATSGLTEKPEEGYWSPRWTETDEEIILEWVETEPPADEFGLPDESLTEN